MEIQLNGKAHDIPPGTSITGLIETLGLADQAYAVEVNKSLVTRREHASHVLEAGDTVEIVTLVGGG